MAYTPTNWQTGDTITAEKLNNIESGVDNAQWKSEEPTQLFSETVTTQQGSDGNSARLSYNEPITADELTVTFDGVEYTCQLIQDGRFNAYGGIGQTGPDFSEYPFALVSNQTSYNSLYTETAGEHTVSVTVKTTSYPSAFTNAVTNIATDTFTPLVIKALNGVMDKTYREIYDAMFSGRSCFVRKSVDVYDGELLMVCYVGGSSLDTPLYEVQVVTYTGDLIEYTTNSVDGYPTLQE